MGPTEQKNIVSQVVKWVEETVWEVVWAVVEEKMKDYDEKLKSFEERLKEKNLESKLFKKEWEDQELSKWFVVDMFKSIWSGKSYDMALAETKATYMNEWTSTEGAEMVFDQFEREIQKVINDYMLVSMVRVFNVTKGDILKVPKATNGITATVVAEWGSDSASKPATAFITINIKKVFSLIDMTDELMEDTMTIPDLYNLIVEMAAESQAEFLENELLNGDWTDLCDGVFNNTGVNVITMDTGDGSVTDVNDTYLVNVMTKAARKYKRRTANVVWVMSQYVYGLLLALKTTDGYPLYPELRNFQSPTLLGHRVIISDKAPVQGSATDAVSTKFIAFGDFSYYLMARRKGVTIEKWYYGDNWKNGIPSLKVTQRLWMAVSFADAFTVLKTASTT